MQSTSITDLKLEFKEKQTQFPKYLAIKGQKQFIGQIE